jgi:hypothetical protein
LAAYFRADEDAMADLPEDDSEKGRRIPPIGGHEVQYFLVGSLIGAILLLILLVIVIQH